MFLIGQAAHLSFVVALAVNLKNNSSKNRGKVSGLLTCVVGGGGALWVSIYTWLSLPDFFLFYASLSGFIHSLALLYIKRVPMKSQQQQQQQHDEFVMMENNVTPLKLLVNVDFWLIFFTMLIQDGTAAMFLSKKEEMVNCLYRDGLSCYLCDNGKLGIIFSIANTVGRFSWVS